MPRQKVTMANNSIMNPTIKYTLSTTALNDKSIYDLHKSIHPTIIASMGYSSRWSEELQYGLHRHHSIKLHHFGLEQLLCKICSVHKFFNHKE